MSGKQIKSRGITLCETDQTYPEALYELAPGYPCVVPFRYGLYLDVIVNALVISDHEVDASVINFCCEHKVTVHNKFHLCQILAISALL